jgi:RNA polymerase sigma-70 factor, ECF subfamily
MEDDRANRMNEPLDRVRERLLILQCQTGDPAGYEELIRRYSPRLKSFLRKMLDDLHAAEDALQELWFDVFRSLGKLQDPGAFTTWLYRIARDRAYRILRRHGRATRPLEEAEVPAPPEDLEADAPQILNASVDLLPIEQREVVLLRFLENMPYDRIADTVGCGIGTVRSRLHYAKRALRREIERSRGHD